MKQNSKNKVIAIIIFIILIGVVSVVFDNNFLVKKQVSENQIKSVAFTEKGLLVDDESSVAVMGKSATIVKGGRYRITGESRNGQLVVDTQNEDMVELYIENLQLYCEENAPIMILSSGDVAVFINGDVILSDGATALAAADRVNACFYSKSDVTLKGDGSLSVKGAYHHGISVRGDLGINIAHLEIESAANAIDTNDTVSVAGGNITLNAGGDGFNAKDKDRTDRGVIDINGGRISITAGDDGLNAFKAINVNGGDVSIECQGNVLKCDGEINVDSECIRAGGSM